MLLREAQRIRVLRAIEDATLLQFTERGYDTTTIESIAYASGVSRRTACRAFPDKDAAFFACEDRRFDLFVTTVGDASRSAALFPAIARGFGAVAQDYHDHRRRHVRWLAVLRRTPALRAQYRARADRWTHQVQDWFVHAGADPADAAAHAEEIIRGARVVLARWQAQDGMGGIDEPLRSLDVMFYKPTPMAARCASSRASR